MLTSLHISTIDRRCSSSNAAPAFSVSSFKISQAFVKDLSPDTFFQCVP
jgi:hypothetical protein